MFKDGIMPEALPERVFQMCKILSNKDVKNEDLRDYLEPAALNTDRSYYGKVKAAAIDLGLVKETEDKKLQYIADKKIVSSIDSFRLYCNSVIWKDRESLFYKMVVAFLFSQDDFLKYSNVNAPNVIQQIQTECKDNNADIKRMRGIRFWLEFLGLGYIQENQYIYFLPNMYIALKDFIRCSSLEKKREYSVREFIAIIQEVSNVAFEKMGNALNLNFAFSNALRMMHDRGEIELKKNLDSKETWSMFKSDVHNFGNSVTHIVYKGIK